MKTITLTVTTDEANIILAALGHQPYIKVADLIQDIQRQGTSQLNDNQVNGFSEKQNDVKAIIPAEDGQ